MAKINKFVFQAFNSLRKKSKKLSLLDGVFILTFFTLLFLFIVFYSRSDDFIEIKIKISQPSVWKMESDPYIEFSQGFFEGDVEKNSTGKVLAQILDVNSYQMSNDRKATYLTLKVKANYNPLKKQYSYNGQPISYGQALEFVFNKIKFEGIVVDFPGFEPKGEEKEILVLAQLKWSKEYHSEVYGVPAYMAEAIKPTKILTSNGEQLVEIVNVESRPALRSVVTSTGENKVIYDKQLKDVFLTLKMKVREIDGDYYFFDDNLVKVEYSVPISTREYMVYPQIIKFLD